VRAGTARILYEGRTYNISRVAEVERRVFLDVLADTVKA
jgi:hypothetical protein